MMFDQAGNLYVVNYNGGTSSPRGWIEKFSSAGTDLGRFASATSASGDFDDYLAIDSSGNVYVDIVSDRVEKYSPTGADLGVFASGFSQCNGMAFDQNGNLFVADSQGGGGTPHNEVWKFSPNGTNLGVFAHLSGAGDVAFDAAGNLYVSSGSANTIREFSPTGVDLGDLPSSGLNEPFGLAFSPIQSGEVWTGLGSDSNWSNADNWQDGVAPTSGDTLVFPSGASQLANNNDLPGGTSFSSIKFTGAGYDLSGNAFRLTSGMNANLTGSGTDTVENNITLPTNTTFTGNPGATLVLSGNLDGSGGLQLKGAGTLDLAGADTYSGATAVNQGKLLLAGSLDTNSTVSVASGATLELSGTLTLEQNATLTDNGSLTVDQGGALDDFGLVTVATTGVLTDSSSGIVGVAGVQVEQGAELNVQGAVTVKAGGTLDDFGSVPVGSTGSIVDQSGAISGVAGVQVEQGAILDNHGTVQVGGLAGGILVVNGLMTGPVTVASGGFLEGTGSVGNVTASNGGTIVPGLIGRIGILNAQSVNLSNGGVLYIQISGYQTPGTDFSRLVTGNLVLGGTSKLTLDLSGLTTRGTVRGIVTDGGQTGTFGTTAVINNPFSFGDTVIYRNDSIDVTIF